MLCICVIIILVISSTVLSSPSIYPVETTPISELTAPLKKGEEIRTICQDFLKKRQAFLAVQYERDRENINTRDMFNRYRGTSAGIPRLIFNMHGVGTWWVPVIQQGRIGGFVKYGAIQGNLKSTPMWKAGGAPMYEISESDWNGLQDIVVERFNPVKPSEGRLVAIPQGMGFFLYFCFPEGGTQVKRIDVMSLPSEKGFQPREMTGQPEAFTASCFEPEQMETTYQPPHSSTTEPSTFSLAVLMPIKDQGQFGSCTGHAASSAFDWWMCGDVCYLGTGDSKEYTCICEKGSFGECECIYISSPQWFYDRFRYLASNDCRENCPGFSCPGDGDECLESLVTSGVMCGISCICEGASPYHSQTVFVNEGGCTAECSPYGCDPGCTDGGRYTCEGDCPNVDGPCGDDFRLDTSFSIERADTQLVVLAIYRQGALITSGNVCECWWGSNGCLCEPVCPCAPEGGHAYVYYGYNKEEFPSRYYFQNSWGTTWGDAGRGELSFGFHYTGPHGGSSYGFVGKGPGAPVPQYRDHEFDDSGGNGNGRPDPDETVDMSITVLNIGEDSSDLSATLSTSDPTHITITNSTVTFPALLHNEEALSSDAFTFQVDPETTPHWVMFYFDFTEGGDECGRDSVEVMIGRPSILFVDDDEGETYDTWYAMELDSLLQRIYDTWTVETQGSVTTDELTYYDAVIWFTGLATETIGPDTTCLREYLAAGGNLFLTGQNIGSDIGQTSFYSDILHAEYLKDNSANYVLVGEEGDVLGDGMTLITSGSGGANNCYSPSEIMPIEPAVSSFKYYGSESSGMIRYENEGNGDYRVVYCATSFEAINSRASRLELMGRILGWMDVYVGIEVTGFNAREEIDGILLTWVSSPDRVRGCNIYRRVKDASKEYEKLNASLIRNSNVYEDRDLTGGVVYQYRLGAIVESEEHFYGPVTVSFSGKGVLPARFALKQNHPNPFNPITKLTYEIPPAKGDDVSVPVQLRIYDVKGQIVKTLVDDMVKPGRYSIVWNGKNERGISLPSGIYYYRLEAGSFSETKKMIILK
jgi:hypothetical protein